MPPFIRGHRFLAGYPSRPYLRITSVRHRNCNRYAAAARPRVAGVLPTGHDYVTASLVRLPRPYVCRRFHTRPPSLVRPLLACLQPLLRTPYMFRPPLARPSAARLSAAPSHVRHHRNCLPQIPVPEFRIPLLPAAAFFGAQRAKFEIFEYFCMREQSSSTA